MIKKLLSFTLCFVFALSLFSYAKPAHALDAKVKVLASTSLYGASGGALLGFASMAFGTSARSIAKGASIGLYAGILFGTYIVVSHYYRPQYEVPYEDSDSPYESGDGATTYEGSGKSLKPGSTGNEDAPKLYDRPFQINQMQLNYKARNTPPLYLDLIRFEF